MPVVTPAQLLLAVAEHGSLETAGASLGLSLEQGRLLVRGAARALQQQQAEASRAPPQARKLEPAPHHAAAPRSGARGGTAASAGAVAGAGAAVGLLAPPGTHPRASVYSDGASRGNPGPAGAGAVVLSPSGDVLARLGKHLGHATNNVAEYQGLLIGLRAARDLGVREVEVVADSELLIRQLQGRYQVKNPELKKLFAEAQSLLAAFEHKSYRHVLRALNAAADEMSNRAIDERL